MKALLAARSDQRLSGLLLRYVELHLSQCSQCRAALESLIALRQAPAEQLTPERADQLTAAFERLTENRRRETKK
jgi:predicted anti-sigma-YlaC factor YlaD